MLQEVFIGIVWFYSTHSTNYKCIVFRTKVALKSYEALLIHYAFEFELLFCFSILGNLLLLSDLFLTHSVT